MPRKPTGIRFEVTFTAPGESGEMWATINEPLPPNVGLLRTRVHSQDDRLVTDGIHVELDKGVIDKGWLRQLPIGAIEARVNLAHRNVLDRVASWYAGDSDRKLDVPPRRPYGDEFYASVSKLYSALLEEGVTAPAQAIAEANDVTVSQVHAWIKRARQRGLLQSGRAGRLG
jgi:hypothetical protein